VHGRRRRGPLDIALELLVSDIPINLILYHCQDHCLDFSVRTPISDLKFIDYTILTIAICQEHTTASRGGVCGESEWFVLL